MQSFLLTAPTSTESILFATHLILTRPQRLYPFLYQLEGDASCFIWPG